MSNYGLNHPLNICTMYLRFIIAIITLNFIEVLFAKLVRTYYNYYSLKNAIK